MKYDIYIGIDPDSVKSGVGVVVLKDGEVHVKAYTMYFAELLTEFEGLKKEIVKLGLKAVVVVEAGWLNDSNWHLTPRDTKPMAAAKGKALGRCEQTGRLIAEMAERIGLTVVLRKPLRKCWRGKDRKITHEELASFTGITGRTNQEARDALLLAWVEADLPIKVKTR